MTRLGIMNISFIKVSLVLLLQVIKSSYSASLDYSNGNVSRPYEIHLRGLFAIYNRKKEACLENATFSYSVQQHAMVQYAIDKVNNESLLKGMKLILDSHHDCWIDTRALNWTFLNWCKSRGDSSKKYWGFIGSDSSVVSVTIAKLLGLLHVPQISYGATSTVLSDKKRFPYFFRTVAPDDERIRAIIHLLEQNSWTYVSFVREDDQYGNEAYESFTTQIHKRSSNVCLAADVKFKRHEEDLPYDHYVQMLLNEKRAKVVIVIAPESQIVKLLGAVNKRNASHRFQWIGMDGWTDLVVNDFTVYQKNQRVSDEISELIDGAIRFSAFMLDNSLSVGFEKYIRRQTIGDASITNPYFADYLAFLNKCSLKNASNTLRGACNDSLTMPSNTALTSSGPFAAASVYAFAYALKNAREDLCGNMTSVEKCSKFTDMTGGEFKSYLENVIYEREQLNVTKLFNEKQDGHADFAVWRYNKTEGWQKVTTYHAGKFEPDVLHDPKLIMVKNAVTSTCNDECKQNEVKIYIRNKPCCWECKPCLANYIVRRNGSNSENDGDECVACDPYKYAETNVCNEIAEEFLSLTHPVAYAVILSSCVGLILVTLIALIYWSAWNTPVIRASGRELSVIILIGLLLMYIVPFLFCVKPTIFVCTLRRIGIGMCFSIIYASLLVKTIRISLVFNTLGKHMIRNYQRLLQPIPQILITLILALVEMFVFGFWFVYVGAEVMKNTNGSEGEMRTKNTRLFLDCKGLASSNLLVGLSFPILLLLICIVFAIKIRKVPVGFNEAKHIGFVVYTTVVIWLAQLTTYSAVTYHNVILRDAVYCLGLSLNGLIILLVLFGPKVYVVLLRPEKNNSRMMMEASSSRYSVVSQHELMRRRSENVQTRHDVYKTTLQKPDTPLQVIKQNLKLEDVASSAFHAMYGDCSCCSSCLLKKAETEFPEVKPKRRRSLPDLLTVAVSQNSQASSYKKRTIGNLIAATHSSMELKRRRLSKTPQSDCECDSLLGEHHCLRWTDQNRTFANKNSSLSYSPSHFKKKLMMNKEAHDNLKNY